MFRDRLIRRSFERAASQGASRPSCSRRSVLALLTAFVATLVPAGPASAQALDLKPLPKGEIRTVKIAVGSVADVTHVAVWYAKYGGIFDRLKADGIEIEVVPFGGGAEWLLALTSGQTQMAHGYFENAIRAHSQGRDVVSIYNILPSPILQVVVRKDVADKYRSVKDAKGAVWGFTSFGSATHVVSLRVARHFGLDQASVKWTPVGGTTGFLPSVREKRVDILTATVFAASQLIQEGSAEMLVDLADPKVVSEIYGNYLGPSLLSSKDFIGKNPFVVYKVTEAVRQSILEIKAKPAEEIARALPEQFQSPVLKASIESVAKALSTDGISPFPAVDDMIQDMGDLKIGRGTLKARDLVDNRFAEALAAAKPK